MSIYCPVSLCRHGYCKPIYRYGGIVSIYLYVDWWLYIPIYRHGGIVSIYLSVDMVAVYTYI